MHRDQPYAPKAFPSVDLMVSLSNRRVVAPLDPQAQ